ncbi:unnamed protein product [Cylindrotheca closterium]|uniref:DUF6824 domain-containing protein n=1 Tax=Cylindrotheca closterium TaxID=2856 RepID=A0AAD2FIM9_9STRA|nr:unnamed protein product [Cylindrotheca closterium]
MALVAERDVLRGMGRGRHAGNQRWRQLVRNSLVAYNGANRDDRMLMAGLIVLEVQDSGGRFLEHDDNVGYLEMSNEDAARMTRQCFINLLYRMRRINDASRFFNNWANGNVDQLCDTLRTTRIVKDLTAKFSTNANFAKLVGALEENQSLKKFSLDLSICKDFESTESMISMLCTAISKHPVVSSLTILIPALGKDSTKAITDLIRVSITLKELRVVDSMTLSYTATAAPQRNGDCASSKKLMKALQENQHLKILAIPCRIAGGLIRFSDFMNYVWNSPRVESASLLGMGEKDTTDAGLKEVAELPRRQMPLIWGVDSRMANLCQESVCQLLEAHPEILIKPAVTTIGSTIVNALPPRVQFWAAFHRGGRYLLKRPYLSLSVWPHVMQAAKPDLIYEFLKQGPFFAGRTGGFAIQSNELPAPPKKKWISRKRKSDEISADLADV